MSRRKRKPQNRKQGQLTIPNQSVQVGQGSNPQAILATSFRQEMSWAGPLPPPEAFRAYEEAVPGAGARLLAMAEDQSKHRMALENYGVKSTVRRSYSGLAAGFLIAVLLICMGTYAIIEHHDWAGATIITGTVVSLVTAFVWGRQAVPKSLADKAQSVGKK